MAIGTTLAFMMGGIRFSHPKMIIFRKVINIKLLVIFAGILFISFTLTGYLFNAIPGQHYEHKRSAMTKSYHAIAGFRNGFTCSSAVFSAFSEEMGLDPDTAKKISCGFGAGISRTGNICGAVSGAILVIGLKYGKTKQGDDAATERTRALVREFIQEFTYRHGSVNCTELLGYNLSKPDEYEKARDCNLFVMKCPEFIGDAAAILEKIL
jgi:C_GCAxxG_C_C family probable redox protein